MYKYIHVQVPADIALSDQDLQTRGQESLLCHLYANDLVTEMQAMKILSIHRRQFHELLKKYNASPLHTEEDLADELLITRHE